MMIKKTMLTVNENYKDMEETKKVIDGIRAGMRVGIMIGPEGGFEQEEVELAKTAGVRPISLGKRILRTETAGLAVISWIDFCLEVQ